MSSHLINGPYKKLMISRAAEKKDNQQAFNSSERRAPGYFGLPQPQVGTPRFGATKVENSPEELNKSSDQSPPKFLSPCYMAQLQPSEIGFRYIESSHGKDFSLPAEVPQGPASTPKSALTFSESLMCKAENPQSPTFREEKELEKHEKLTESVQAKDLKVKIRVRMAKFVLRGVSFGCSLIVLTMISTSFSIFNASKHLPPRNHLPPWAVGTKVWPQALVLATSCVSLACCIMVFWSYYRGGHRKAEKFAAYYTFLAVAFFLMSTVMWGIAAGVLQRSRNNSLNKDMWGWSCVDNKRRQLFSEKVDYALVCRMQNWTLVCCIIEIVLESITILLYCVVFYRYHSKQRLRKSMDVRDRARSNLYLAQFQSEASPNPLLSQTLPQPSSPQAIYQKKPLEVIAGSSIGQFVQVKPTSAVTTEPFTLQPAPLRNFPPPSSLKSAESNPVIRAADPPYQYTVTAPGEQTYDIVPIPGPYNNPMTPFNPSSRYGSV